MLISNDYYDGRLRIEPGRYIDTARQRERERERQIDKQTNAGTQPGKVNGKQPNGLVYVRLEIH